MVGIYNPSFIALTANKNQKSYLKRIVESKDLNCCTKHFLTHVLQ